MFLGFVRLLTLLTNETMNTLVRATARDRPYYIRAYQADSLVYSSGDPLPPSPGERESALVGH